MVIISNHGLFHKVLTKKTGAAPQAAPVMILYLTDIGYFRSVAVFDGEADAAHLVFAEAYNLNHIA